MSIMTTRSMNHTNDKGEQGTPMVTLLRSGLINSHLLDGFTMKLKRQKKENLIIMWR